MLESLLSHSPPICMGNERLSLNDRICGLTTFTCQRGQHNHSSPFSFAFIALPSPFLTLAVFPASPSRRPGFHVGQTLDVAHSLVARLEWSLVILHSSETESALLRADVHLCILGDRGATWRRLRLCSIAPPKLISSRRSQHAVSDGVRARLHGAYHSCCETSLSVTTLFQIDKGGKRFD